MDWMKPRTRKDAEIKKRIDRLEAAMIALIGKVRKMAQGQAHFEQSFQNLQTSITDLGSRLDAAMRNMVAAHDNADDEAFEQHATALDQMVNEVRNLGTSGNTATTSGQSPTTATDLRQNAGPTQADLDNARNAQNEPSGQPQGLADFREGPEGHTPPQP